MQLLGQKAGVFQVFWCLWPGCAAKAGVPGPLTLSRTGHCQPFNLHWSVCSDVKSDFSLLFLICIFFLFSSFSRNFKVDFALVALMRLFVRRSPVTSTLLYPLVSFHPQLTSLRDWCKDSIPPWLCFFTWFSGHHTLLVFSLSSWSHFFNLLCWFPPCQSGNTGNPKLA